MKKLLNVALIGCGRVAGHHALSISKIPELMNLVAVCDLVIDRANELAAHHNVFAYYNYFKMLKEHPEIDVVSVITPSGMHFEHALDVICDFKKHVIIEKPMVMTLTQGRELKKKANINGVKIFPVFQYRFNKSVQRVKSTHDNNDLGELFLATVRTRWCRPQKYYDRDPWRGTYSHDGGALTNQGIHHLDLLRYLAGEVKKVNAQMKTFGVHVEIEDTIVANLEFESGAIGIIEITTAARPDDFESSISVLGDKGLAIVGGWATNDLITFSPDPEQEALNSEIFPDVYGFGHKQIYIGVYESIVNNGKPAVEFEDGIKTIQLLHSIYRSAGIREGAFIGTPVVNIGMRQMKRMHGDNVIDVDYKSSEIVSAVKMQFKKGKYKTNHIYGDGKAGEKITEILSYINPPVQKLICY